MAAKFTGMIKFYTPDEDEAAGFIELFKKNQATGARSVASNQVDCISAELQLLGLENSSKTEIADGGSVMPARLSATPGQDAVLAGRGAAAGEIRFGASVPFTGANKIYGQQIKTGIETAFRAANDAGGVHGRMLTLVAIDDGYEPARTAETVKQLAEKEQVFGFFGNFGTATAAVSVPFALERRMLFFAGYSGAPVLRRDPPDRFVFNYRPSYAEETEAAVRYLVKVRRIKPDQIAVFAQQDAFGDAGFAGVAKAMRALRGGDGGFILRLGYQRNSIDVSNALAQLKAHKGPIKAVVMMATTRAAAKFIEATRDAYPNLTYTNPSVAGASALRDELMLLGPKYMTGVIVTQTVPAVDGYSSLVLEYKAALAKYFGAEPPDATSLEYYIAGRVLIEALKRAGPQADTEKLVEALEGMHDFDLGLGVPVNFSKSEHQGLHKVWGTELTEAGKFEPIDMQ